MSLRSSHRTRFVGLLLSGVITCSVFLIDQELRSSALRGTLTDVNPNSYEGKAVIALEKHNIISGFPDGTFRGLDEVNRAQAAKLLLVAARIPLKEIQNNTVFSDVPRGAWFEKFVMNAKAQNIMNGYADGTFRPEKPIIRAEFLAMLARTFTLETDTIYSYRDVPSNVWFSKYAGLAEKHHLFINDTDVLSPSKTMTRNDVAWSLYQMLALKYKGEVVAVNAKPSSQKTEPVHAAADEAVVEKCSDSDRGVNTAVRGKTTGPLYPGGALLPAKQDSCVEENVREYFCTQEGLLFEITMPCKDGQVCKAGACITKEALPSSTLQLPATQPVSAAIEKNPCALLDCIHGCKDGQCLPDPKASSTFTPAPPVWPDLPKIAVPPPPGRPINPNPAPLPAPPINPLPTPVEPPTNPLPEPPIQPLPTPVTLPPPLPITPIGKYRSIVLTPDGMGSNIVEGSNKQAWTGARNTQQNPTPLSRDAWHEYVNEGFNTVDVHDYLGAKTHTAYGYDRLQHIFVSLSDASSFGPIEKTTSVRVRLKTNTIGNNQSYYTVQIVADDELTPLTDVSKEIRPMCSQMSLHCPANEWDGKVNTAQPQLTVQNTDATLWRNPKLKLTWMPRRCIQNTLCSDVAVAIYVADVEIATHNKADQIEPTFKSVTANANPIVNDNTKTTVQIRGVINEYNKEKHALRVPQKPKAHIPLEVKRDGKFSVTYIIPIAEYNNGIYIIPLHLYRGTSLIKTHPVHIDVRAPHILSPQLTHSTNGSFVGSLYSANMNEDYGWQLRASNGSVQTLKMNASEMLKKHYWFTTKMSLPAGKHTVSLEMYPLQNPDYIHTIFQLDQITTE